MQVTSYAKPFESVYRLPPMYGQKDAVAVGSDELLVLETVV